LDEKGGGQKSTIKMPLLKSSENTNPGRGRRESGQTKIANDS